MTIVAPSLLACDFLNIENELREFEGGLEDFWFHLDVMDGHFVPNLTFGHPIVKRISKKTNYLLDAHFMVANPSFYVETFQDFGIHNVTFHTEVFSSEGEVIQLIEKARNYYPSVGISIKPGTAVSDVSDNILSSIDLFLMMSVEPGFGGQEFIEDTYSRLDELVERRSKLGAKFQIQVDGGVNNINAKELIRHGAENLVAGSYVFKEGPINYKRMVASLRMD